MAFYALDGSEVDRMTFAELRAYKAWMLSQATPSNSRAAGSGRELED
jgi:hypothetical protein